MGRKSERPAARRLPVAVETRYSPAVLEGIAEGERKVLLSILTEARDDRAWCAAETAAARAHELAAVAVAREPPPAPIACRRGCAFCCHAKVLVVAPEVLRIARWLRDSLDDEALARLVERVREADERTRGLSRAERAAERLPCPLLADGACSVHEVRPLTCAGWTSLDVGACERSYEQPEAPSAPVHAPSHALTIAVTAGLIQACRDAGLDGEPLELVAALRIALERPTAEARWLAKLPVFAQARDLEGSGRPRS